MSKHILEKDISMETDLINKMREMHAAGSYSLLI